MVNNCCVPNCESVRQDVLFHKIPPSGNRLDRWLISINCAKLRVLSKTKLRSFFVCHKHFEKRFVTPKGHLFGNAYPTLFSDEEISSGVPSQTFTIEDKENECTLAEHSYSRKRLHDHTYAKTKKRRALTTLTAGLEDFNVPIPSTSSCPTLVPESTLKPLDTECKPKSCRKKIIKNTNYLTPLGMKLYCEFKKSKKQLNYAKRTKRAIDFSQQLEEKTRKMSQFSKQFLWMQIKLCMKTKKGRRFSLEEKLIGLAIMKQSPKCYRFLQKIFILPNKTTLNKMIGGLQLKTGINSQILATIKSEVKDWCSNKKICTVIFDEMALESTVSYDKKADHLTGFVELPDRRPNYADHALCFILRGAIYKWQQPLAYYFTKGAVSAIDLKAILKTVVQAIVDAGLMPIALVSDQGSSFVSALKNLQQDTREHQIKSGVPTDGTIHLSNAILSVIYDPCHLIKGLRNNFLSKNIVFENKICTWQDIVDVYLTDSHHAESRILHKLNDEHVIPEKIKKMKVKNCVRVFSKTMAAALNYTSSFSTYADGKPVSSTLRNTAAVVTFFDDLFDSVNGAQTLTKKRGKSLKTAVTATSSHVEFWDGAVRKLATLKFINSYGKKVAIPSINNWRTTLQSYARVWQFVQTKNIKIFRPRYFNSDPVENFFGRVRSYNYRNVNPDCCTFANTFKSLLITGIINFHSENFNCEESSSNPIVKVQELFSKMHSQTTPDKEEIVKNLEMNTSCNEESIYEQAVRQKINVNSQAYTVGWVIRKTLKNNNCLQCHKKFKTQEINATHSWIREKEYKTLKSKKLTYPSEYAVRAYAYIVKEANAYLEHNPEQNNIKDAIINSILSKYALSFLICETHKNIFKYFLEVSVRLCIHNWCNTINKIFKGTDIVRLERRTSIIPPMQQKALDRFKKKMKNKIKR